MNAKHPFFLSIRLFYEEEGEAYSMALTMLVVHLLPFPWRTKEHIDAMNSSIKSPTLDFFLTSTIQAC